MPEGPEVRKYADAVDAVLKGRAIRSLEARTKDARLWLKENENRLIGCRVERVVSHGKHLIGYVEGEFFFHSHLMMWGRWQTFDTDALPEKDRRERVTFRTPVNPVYCNRKTTNSTLLKFIHTKVVANRKLAR